MLNNLNFAHQNIVSACITGIVYKWNDFLIRTDIAGMNTNYVWYASLNTAAEEYNDQEIFEYGDVYLSDELFTGLQWLENVVDATELNSRILTEIKAR